MMKTVMSCTALGVALVFSSLANAAPPPSPERQAMFEEFKRIESRSHQGRVTILQEAEICIQQAQNREQFRACEQKEKAGRKALRDELRPQREALRTRVHAQEATDSPIP